MARPSVEAQRREEIMRSACAQIAAKGVLGLRVSDVAKGAGVSPGIVHYYFETKFELIRAAFEDNFTRSLDRRAAIFDDKEAHAADSLHAIVESYLPLGEETIEAWNVWIELWAAALQDEALAEVNDRAYSRWASMIEAVVARGQERGELVAEDSALIADSLMGLIDGLSVQVLLSSHGMTVERMRAICHRLVDSIST